MNSIRFATILLCFFVIPFSSFSQLLSTDEKIEMLGLAAQSSEVITAATEGDFTLDEIDQANSMKNKGITDAYIVSAMKQHKKLSVTDILKIKEYIDKGYPASAINKSISEKPNFPSAAKPIVAETKEEVKPKEEKELKNYFAFNVGALFPISKFSETNANSSSSGYASTGIGAGFNYQHYFIENVGLSMTLHFNHNFLNTDELDKDAQSYYGQGVTVTSYEGNGLSLFNFGLGPAFAINLNQPKTVAAELIANGGIALLYAHGRNIYIVDNGNSDTYRASLSANYQFTYFFDGQVGLKYMAGKKTYLALRGGYCYSKMNDLSRTAKGYTNGKLEATEKGKTSQEIHNISLMLSIGGKF